MKNVFLLLIGATIGAAPVSWAHGPAPDCAVLLKMSDKEAYARGPVLEAIRRECVTAALEGSEKKAEETKSGHGASEKNNVESDSVPTR